MFISPQQMGYSIPNMYLSYPTAQRRQLSDQKQMNVAMSREASRRGFKSVAEMQAAQGGGAGAPKAVNQKDRLEAARKEWAAKAQAEAQKRVSDSQRFSSLASQTYSNPYTNIAPQGIRNPYINYSQLEHLSPESLDSWSALGDAGLKSEYVPDSASSGRVMVVPSGRNRLPYANAYWSQGR